TSDVMPAVRKLPMTHSMSGTPATGTSGLGIEKPVARRRLPSPAAMMPPRQRIALVTGAAPGSKEQLPKLAERPNHAIVRAAGPRRCRGLAGQPDVHHADATSAGHVAGQRVADERDVARLQSERAQGVRENARIWLGPSDVGRIDDHTEQRTKTDILAHPRKVAVEVGDDAELVVTRQLGQDRDAVPRRTGRVVHEAP